MHGRCRAWTIGLVLVSLLAACRGEVQMNPGGGTFLAFPWPNDIRVKADGSLDLFRHPGQWHGLIADIVSTGAAGTHGFGSSAGVFFSVTAPVDPGSMPTEEESTSDASSVMLVDIDPASPSHDKRYPVDVEYDLLGGFYTPASTLSVVPTFGVPLEEGTRHAAILYRGLRDVAGQPLRRSPLIDRLEGDWTETTGIPEDTFHALAEQWASVKAYVETSTEWDPDEVVAFTVYTTQEVTPKMVAIARTMGTLADPLPGNVTVVQNCKRPEDTAVLHGTTDLPVWLTGISPYVDQGGDVVVGQDGNAVVQGTETVRFEATFPCRTAPQEGWPVLAAVNGTGGDFQYAKRIRDSFWGDDPAGYATFSIAPTLSGDRLPPELISEARRQLANLGYGALADLVLAEDGILYFNFFNGVAGKNNQRQQAADIVWLSRFARSFDLPADTVGAESDLTTDDATMAYFGHSQGAVPAPIAFRVDGSYGAAFLSAPGGGFIHSILHRRDIREIVNGILLFGDELDDHHLLAHIVQTLAEEGDPTVYATDMQVPHVLMTEGIHDGCSIREAAEQVAGAARFPVAEPVLRPPHVIEDVLGLSRVPLPAAGNTPEGTRLLLQLDAQHFGVQANPGLARTFFDSYLADGIPTVAAGPFVPERNTTKCIRWD